MIDPMLAQQAMQQIGTAQAMGIPAAGAAPAAGGGKLQALMSGGGPASFFQQTARSARAPSPFGGGGQPAVVPGQEPAKQQSAPGADGMDFDSFVKQYLAQRQTAPGTQGG